MSDIFISYASEDRERAKALAEALQAQDWSVWWDRDLPFGRPFDEVIRTELRSASCVIVLWTESATKSWYVIGEARDGLRLQKLISVFLSHAELPYDLQAIQGIELFDWHGEIDNPDYQRLISGITTLIGEQTQKEHSATTEETREGREEEQRKTAVEAKRQTEAERKRKEAEKKRLAKERGRKSEEERKRKQEEERKRKEEAQRKAEAEAKRKAEEELKGAEAEAKRKAEEQRLREEEHRRAEEEARRRAEEQKRKEAEEAKRKAEQETEERKRLEEDRRQREARERAAKEEARREPVKSRTTPSAPPMKARETALPRTGKPMIWVVAGVLLLVGVGTWYMSQQHNRRVEAEALQQAAEQQARQAQAKQQALEETQRQAELQAQQKADAERKRKEELARLEEERVQPAMEIAQLLERAREAENALRLTTPPHDNAASYYRQVLDRDEDNPDAQQGLARIAQRYLAWAEQALAQRRFDKVEENLEKAASVDPDHSGIRELTQQSDAVQKAEEDAKREAELEAKTERQRRALLEAKQKADLEAELEAKRRAELAAKRESERKAKRVPVPEMVKIRPGAFLMGSPKKDRYTSFGYEFPQHEVILRRPFAIGKYEVTFEEYDAYAQATGRTLPPDARAWGRGKRPVINVSWDDAVAYAEWLSQQTGQRYRLPTEAEWEYAARAGTTTRYWWGNKVGKNRANCRDCRSQWGDQTAPVGSFPANPFGLHDTAGNVQEWVQDRLHKDYEGAPTDGSAWEDKRSDLGYLVSDDRVIRGGSWGGDAGDVRSAERDGYHPRARHLWLGFRLAQDL
ncbi:MAG: SUMF1/EgtB/PvdO family nonheme iron enzyme [Gammaproteobacteria bacterium]|nr:SUMF1/EgtB/PvdO family nonheme iron enzyme [Gammaproteobacteria bacterium]